MALAPHPEAHACGPATSGRGGAGRGSHLSTQDTGCLHAPPRPVHQTHPARRRTLPGAAAGGPGRAAGQTASAETPGREGSGSPLWGQETRGRPRVSEEPAEASLASPGASSGEAGCLPGEPAPAKVQACPPPGPTPPHTPDHTEITLPRAGLPPFPPPRPVKNSDLESQSDLERPQ